MMMEVFHGTNQDFDHFDPDLLGMANPNTASRAAFFFARRQDTAWDYAYQAARRLIPDQAEHEKNVRDILDRAEKAMRRGDHNASEALYLKAEDLETRAMQAEPEGARVLRCNVVLENPLEVDGLCRKVVTDLGSVLESAKSAGHDGVIIKGIQDTPSGEGYPDDHIAIFDPSRISIVEVMMESDMDPILEPDW